MEDNAFRRHYQQAALDDATRITNIFVLSSSGLRQGVMRFGTYAGFSLVIPAALAAAVWAGQTAAVTNSAALTATAWAAWQVPLSQFAGVNLSRVKVLYLGVGDRQAPAQGGAGRLHIDDIRVKKSERGPS
jgi:hypothetical protein